MKPRLILLLVLAFGLFGLAKAASPARGGLCLIIPGLCQTSRHEEPLYPVIIHGDECPVTNRRFLVTITSGANVVCNGTREWHSLTVEHSATITQSQIGDTTGPESNLTYLITVEDMIVQTGGKIDVSGKGYRGGQPPAHHIGAQTSPYPGSPGYMNDPNWRWYSQGDGRGPAWGVGVKHAGLGSDSGNCRGESSGGGGGHAGRGGGPVNTNAQTALPPPEFSRRPTYGDPTAPITAGSGGGSYIFHRRGSALQRCGQGESEGAAGGGAIRLKARKITLTTDQGTGIFANGLDGPGGGAGGSIWIEVQEDVGAAATVNVAGGTAVANPGEVGTAPPGSGIPRIGGGKLEAKGGNASRGHGGGGGGGRIKLNFFVPPGPPPPPPPPPPPGGTGGPPPPTPIWKIVDSLPSPGGTVAVENLRSVQLDSAPFSGFTLSGSTLTFNTLPTGTHRLTFVVTVKSTVSCAPPNNLLTNLAELFKDATSKGTSQASLSVNCREIVLQGDVRSGANIEGGGKRLELPLGILEAVGNITGLNGVKNLPGYSIGNDSVLFWDASNPVKNRELEKNLKRLEGERAKPWSVSSFSGGNLFLDTNQATPDQVCTIPAGCNPPADGQVWRVPGSLSISGNLTVRGRGTIIVDGNLRIAANISYGGLNDSVGFLVKGDLSFAPSSAAGAQRLVGAYFTPRTILFSDPGATSQKVIEIAGSLVADQFNFAGRDGGDPSGLNHRIKLAYDNRVNLKPPPGFELFLGPRSAERAP